MPLRKKRNTRVANKIRQGISEAVPHNGFYAYYRAFLRDTETTCSQDTIKRRESALRRFIVWCGERDLQQPHDITKPILERYKRHLYYYRKSNGDPLSTGSQHTLLTPLRAFFRYLAKENHILYNPASELDIPKKPKRLPKAILHQDEINDVLNTIDVTTVSGIRDRAMIETLYSTGMRRMELVNLTLYDIDYRRGAIWIREGKYQKDRFVPIGDNALSWIVNYQEQARSDLVMEPDKGILFLTDYGEALSNLVKRYLTRAGITTLGSCHLFRHACATHMLENGADIRFIQQLLGHEDLSTTQIYTQVSIDKLKAIHRATHPSDSRVIEDEQDSNKTGKLSPIT